MSAWEAGDYNGEVIGGECVTASTGTPGLNVTFDVAGHKKVVSFWLSDAAIESSLKQLETLGFNRNFADPQFSKKGPHLLTLKFEDYKGRQQERWQLKYVGQPIARDQIERLNARARAMGGPPPRPVGAPPAAPAPSAPPPAVSQSAPPPAGCTRDEAWEKCVMNSGDESDPERMKRATSKWNKAVADVCDSTKKPESQFGPVEWASVRRFVDIPF